MGDLFWNKIAGALLAIVLVVMGLRTFGEALFHDTPYGGGEASLAYPIDLAALGVSSEPAEAEEEGPVDYGSLLAAASVSAGERVANRCASCHNFEQGAGHGTGPNLYAVMGAPVAGEPDYNYSNAFEEYAEGGTEWGYQNMDEFLANPRGYISGTAMSFAGLRDEEDRINLIAYMRTLDSDPLPLPEPLPEESAQGEAGAGESASSDLGPEMVNVDEADDAEGPSEETSETASPDDGEADGGNGR